MKLKILWSSFFDDYVTLSRPELASSTQNSVQALFKLLGWLFAQDGKKAEPFNSSCVALGVKFDLSDSIAGRAFVCNTQSRVSELCAELEDLVNKGGVGVARARSIQGRMMFADSQILGRAGKRCMKVLALAELSGWHRFSEFEVSCIKQFTHLLQSGPPREFGPNSWERVCVFTDACYEADARDWKSGIFDENGVRREFFSSETH